VDLASIRFYLNQTGLGIFYLLFFWFPVMWIVGLIDAITFFSMDNEAFDRKYNNDSYKDTDFDRRERGYRRDERRNRRPQERQRARRYEERRSNYRKPTPPPAPKPPVRKHNPYKISGVKKYKDFDYDGAIEDFEQALKIAPKDIATHFNIACAYSLNEDADKAFFHLDKAVALGFTDFKRIREHDALAYLRIQPPFEDFEKNNFRLESPFNTTETSQKEVNDSDEAAPDLLSQEPNLLDQLQRLGELRDKGLLTESEFTMQKKKLLG
jgi:TM2 domain-containing membrane protein YozV